MRETYDKLVRDDIPDLIRADGETPETDRVSGEQYRARLHEKLDEEVAEFHDDPSPEELADVRAVLDALQSAESIAEQDVRDARERKRKERGAFADGIVLHAVRSANE